MYIVNRKYYTNELQKAILIAKNILKARAEISDNFLITKGKKEGYCVKSLDDWEKFGNINLTKVIIQKVELSY